MRNVVRWVRPNPPVGALGDKYRPATSEMIVATKSAGRWFDLDAVRQPLAESTVSRGEGSPRGNGKHMDEGTTNGAYGRHFTEQRSNPAGAPPLDWWEIPTATYKGAHYATWPPALCERPIESMCPERVCRTCGKPSERIVGEVEYVPSATNRGGVLKRDAKRVAEGANQWVGEGGAGAASVVRHAPTVGWSDCGHDDWRPGVVLDPFAGSGTTLAVATGLGRAAIGIDLDERNLDLARERVGMFLEAA